MWHSFPEGSQQDGAPLVDSSPLLINTSSMAFLSSCPLPTPSCASQDHLPSKLHIPDSSSQGLPLGETPPKIVFNPLRFAFLLFIFPVNGLQIILSVEFVPCCRVKKYMHFGVFFSSVDRCTWFQDSSHFSPAIQK